MGKRRDYKEVGGKAGGVLLTTPLAIVGMCHIGCLVGMPYMGMPYMGGRY